MLVNRLRSTVSIVRRCYGAWPGAGSPRSRPSR